MSRPPFGVPVVGNRWDALEGVQPDPAPAVTVIIAHYEQPRQLALVLAALRRQTHPWSAMQVVVVDDGSAVPPTVPDDVQLLVQDDRGFRLAAARNLGIAAATGQVLCFLDADTVPEPGYIAAMTRLPALAPETVVVGRRRHADLASVPPDEPIELAGPAHELPEPAWLRDEFARSGDLLHADHRSYRLMIGAVLACSRWFADEVGGFDESFTEYGGEDWEWAARAWRAGAVLAYAADAVAWHDGPDAGGRDSDQQRRNRQTLRLLHDIPVAGSRALALTGPVAELVVRLEADASEAGILVTVDSMLTALPHARIRVAVPLPSAADGRVGMLDAPDPPGVLTQVVLHDTARVIDTEALAELLTGVGCDDLGVLVLADDAGPVLTATSVRATAREQRWGSPCFETRVLPAGGVLARLTDEPDLAAYLGGWG